jgi:hypothetical protein
MEKILLNYVLKCLYDKNDETLALQAADTMMDLV